MSTTHSKKMLGVFSLAMISVAAIINLRSLPLMASIGLPSVFFYLCSGLLFLIPSGLVCAELATSYPQAGGVYLWVKQAFGGKTGFVAIWLEWINNVISFPASLATMAATLSYLINPTLASNKIYLFTCTLIILWFATWFNCRGIKASSRLNIIGAMFGTLIPGALIIGLGAYWLFSHHASQINFAHASIFPAWHYSSFVFFSGVLSAYAGMQITAFHAPNVINPQKNYTRAILLAMILILCTTIFASLAIAIVVPKSQLNLVAGLIEGFNSFFRALHLSWATPILVILILLGSFSGLSAWLLGPARGLAVAAKQGHFFKRYAEENENGAPRAILILQAWIATIFASLFLFLPNASTAFWMLLDMSSQSTLLLYLLMFGSVIWLRYSEPNTKRPFKIPGGKIGVWIVCLPAMMISVVGIFTGFMLPTSIAAKNQLNHYELILIICTIIYLMIPLLLVRRRKNLLNIG